MSIPNSKKSMFVSKQMKRKQFDQKSTIFEVEEENKQATINSQMKVQSNKQIVKTRQDKKSQKTVDSEETKKKIQIPTSQSSVDVLLSCNSPKNRRNNSNQLRFNRHSQPRQFQEKLKTSNSSSAIVLLQKNKQHGSKSVPKKRPSTPNFKKNLSRISQQNSQDYSFGINHHQNDNNQRAKNKQENADIQQKDEDFIDNQGNEYIFSFQRSQQNPYASQELTIQNDQSNTSINFNNVPDLRKTKQLKNYQPDKFPKESNNMTKDIDKEHVKINLIESNFQAQKGVHVVKSNNKPNSFKTPQTRKLNYAGYNLQLHQNKSPNDKIKKNGNKSRNFLQAGGRYFTPSGGFRPSSSSTSSSKLKSNAAKKLKDSSQIGFFTPQSLIQFNLGNSQSTKSLTTSTSINQNFNQSKGIKVTKDQQTITEDSFYNPNSSNSEMMLMNQSINYNPVLRQIIRDYEYKAKKKNNQPEFISSLRQNGIRSITPQNFIMPISNPSQNKLKQMFPRPPSGASSSSKLKKQQQSMRQSRQEKMKELEYEIEDQFIYGLPRVDIRPANIIRKSASKEKSVNVSTSPIRFDRKQKFQKIQRGAYVDKDVFMKRRYSQNELK